MSLRDLNSKIPGAESFTYKEFVTSETAIRKGIKNEPNEEQWKAIEELARNVLQPIRNKFGRIRITSGFRSVALCNAVGSNSNSNHARGEAADIEPIEPNVTLMDILLFIHECLPYRELIAEFFPNGWVHVAYRKNGNEKILKLKDNKHNYDRVKIDEIKKIYK